MFYSPDEKIDGSLVGQILFENDWFVYAPPVL
jgi:hypothetical protein